MSNYCPKCRGDNVKNHDLKRGRLRCVRCKVTWSKKVSTLYYGLRTSESKINRALQMFATDMPIRKIAYYLKISPSTVMRWKKRSSNPTNYEK